MTLDMLVSRPSFPLKMITGPILDIDALRDSITLLPSISGERENTDTPYTLVVSGERIIISASG